MDKIEIKNLCPMIAMISAGKTSILKVIFDVDFLEATAGIGTKFVNIIRYNPSVGKNPKFYHLIVKKTDNEDYDFYKDPNFPVISGSENIKKKNEELNEEYKNKTDVPYDDLFYMIEIGEANFIEDKEYLKNYDLVDIPGVNEYNPDENDNINKEPTKENNQNSEAPPPFIEYEIQQIEDNNNNKNKNENKNKIYESIEEELDNEDEKEQKKNYLTQIFTILKNKMNNGIIVLSIDNYQHVENYRIIGRLQKVINKPIENFLILLNKIDKSENKKNDLNTLNNKIMKYFPSCERFNPTKNLIIPCSKLQLENELKMDKCFKNLLYYHFLNFLMKSKAKTPDTPTTSGSSFIDFLKTIYSEQKIKKKKFIEKITKVIDDNQLSKILKEITDIIIYIKEKHQDENLNLGVRDDDFKEEDIANIKNEFEINENEEQNEQEEDEENENFNLYELEGNVIILLYYSDFKNKKNIPPKSMDTVKIMKYFTMENMNKKKEDEIDNTIEKEIEKKINEEKSKAEKIDDLSKKMLRLYDKCKEENLKSEKLKQLQKYINSSIGILKTSKQLYIPMLGLSNAGKSTILNGIVGSRILPTEKNECTKKGILIKHWNKEYPVIRKTKFKKEKLGDEDIYYFESNEKFITKGLENIHHVLEGTNGEFTQNEENFFYEININIKFVNDLKIDDNLKEKICFIDLPGFGTANVFERKDIYAHLMKSCNIFLFVAFNLTIKENNNKKMLDNLYNTMSQFTGIPTQAFIKKCIFIVNCDKDQDMSNKNLNQAKKDIIQIINGLDESILNDINVCFFNAKYYENFIFKTLSYNSTQSLIYDIYDTYNQLKEGKFKGYIDKIKGGTFIKYLKERLLDDVKNDIKEKFDEKKVIQNSDIENDVSNILTYNKIKCTKNDISLIAKYITFEKENLCKSNLLSQSNIDIFTRDLLVGINKAKDKEEEEINKNLRYCFKILDNVFDVDPNTKFGQFKEAPIAKIIIPHADEDLQKMVNEVNKLLDSIKIVFSEYDVVKILKSCSQEITNSLIKERSNIEKNLKQKGWKNIQSNFESTFKNKTNNLKEELLNALNNSSSEIQSNLTECYNLLNEFYSTPLNSNQQLYKDYISNCLGEKNIEKTIQQIVNDIINGSKRATEYDKCSGFFNWLGNKLFDSNYLEKTINYMINESLKKIEAFSDKIEEESKKYKAQLIDEISISKQKVEEVLLEKKEEEELAKREEDIKNENERKKWEREKEMFENKKKKWEEVCKEYLSLRYEIYNLRLTKDN